MLVNGNDPQGRKLSEAQISDMQAFLEQLQTMRSTSDYSRTAPLRCGAMSAS